MSASNETAEPKPDLKVVGTAEAGSGEASAPQQAVDAASDQATPDATREAAQASPLAAPPERSRLPLLLGVALVFAIVFALWQGQRADRLASAVGQLEAELSVVGAELSAHKAHLSRVRVGIDDLASRTQALSDLAHAEPSTSTSTSTGSTGASPSEPEAPVGPAGDGYTSPSESGIVDF